MREMMEKLQQAFNIRRVPDALAGPAGPLSFAREFLATRDISRGLLQAPTPILKNLIEQQVPIGLFPGTGLPFMGRLGSNVLGRFEEGSPTHSIRRRGRDFPVPERLPSIDIAAQGPDLEGTAIHEAAHAFDFRRTLLEGKRA